MMFDPLKPVATGHNIRAVKVAAFLFGVLFLHLFLLESEFSALGARLLTEGPWPSLPAYSAWLQGSVNFWPLLLSCALFLGLALFLQAACDIVNQFLDWAFDSTLRTYAFLCIVLAAFLNFYLSPGPIAESGDASAHLMHAWLAGESLRQGELPVWSNWLYCGSPFLQDYGPLFFYAAGAAFALLRDLSLSTKAVLFLFHLLSGLAFFHMACAVWREKRIALLGSLGYALIGWHSHYILIMGRYPVAPLYVLLPLIFLEAHRLLENPWDPFRKALPAVVRLSIYSALAVFCHFIYPAQFALFLAIYVFARIFIRYRETRDTREAGRTLAGFCAAVLGACLLTAGCLVPFVVERADTMAGAHMALTDPLGEAGRTFNIPAWFVWNNDYSQLFSYGSPQWGDAYFGLVLFLTLPAALLAAFVFRRKPVLGSTLKAAGIVLAVFFLLVVFWGPVGKIPLLRSLYITAVERYQLSLAFFLPLFACAFIADSRALPFMASAPGRFRAFMPFVLAALALDLGSLSLQAPFAPRGDWDRHAALTATREKEFRANKSAMPPKRAYYEGISSYDFELKGAPMAVRRAMYPTFLGSYSQGAPLSYLYIKEFYPQIKDQFEGRAHVLLDKRLLNLFFLTNTPLLVLNGEKDAGACPFVKNKTSFNGEKTVLELDFGSPVVYSGITARFEGSGNAGMDGRWLLERQNIDYASGYSDTLFVREPGLPELPAGDARPVVRVTGFSQTHRTVDMTISASRPVYARLPYSWHPALSATLNGIAVRLVRADMNFVCLAVPAGENRIHLEGGVSALRKRLWLVSGLAFLAGFMFLLLRKKVF